MTIETCIFVRLTKYPFCAPCIFLELLNVNKNDEALDILSEQMKNKRNKANQSWTKHHEDCMRLIMELCITSRNPQTFKEVIHQYKNMVSSVSGMLRPTKCY